MRRYNLIFYSIFSLVHYKSHFNEGENVFKEEKRSDQLKNGTAPLSRSGTNRNVKVLTVL